MAARTAPALTSEQEDELVRLLSDRDWRLRNLYWIKDEAGRVVKFRPNWAQQHVLDNLHSANLHLKARQVGITTLIQILQLDACLWAKNVRAVTIAHTVDVAKEIFRDKVKFAYEALPPEIRQMIPAEQDSAESLAFSNGSSFRVSNIVRGGTYQWLHVTELAYVDRKYPEKAQEIRTGALNTVHPGQVINVESTARGKLGLFYEISEDAQDLQRQGAQLGLMDYRFHFFPWWRHPGYALDEPAPKTFGDYFKSLEKHGIHLTDGQKAWYAKKAKTQKASIKAEFPSTPEEAFEGAEGIFFDCFDRDLHVVRPFKIPEHWTRFRSEDWGTARPFSIGWYTVASETVRTPCGKIIPRGALIKYREWYGVATDEAGAVIPNVGIKSTPQRVGKGIVEREAFGEKPAYHVADPSMWNDVGGPTQARMQYDAIRKVAKELGKPHSDVMWRKGNNMRVRRGTAKGGWDQMRERLIGEEGPDGVERPMLYFFGTCVHSIRTIPGLMHDENNPEDVDTEGEDHAADECFGAGTLVDTASGPVPIERLSEGMVHSISGIEPFHYGRLTRRNARVIKLTFGDMRSIICTPDHRFLTSDGWVRAADMKGRLCQRSSAPQFRNTAAFGITSVVATISTKALGFIGWFGKTLTGRSLMGFTSITKTTTTGTTRYRTSSLSRRVLISAIMARSTAAIRRVFLRLEMQRRLGMVPRLAGSGTSGTTPSIAQAKCMPGQTRIASNVGCPTLVSLYSGFAQMPANRPFDVPVELTTLMRSAAFVARCFGQIAIGLARRVAGNAGASYLVTSVEDAGKADVYCLTVPTTEAFSVNGLVVHNCRYACMSRPYESPKPTEKKPMTDLSDVSLNRLWKEQEQRAG